MAKRFIIIVNGTQAKRMRFEKYFKSSITSAFQTEILETEFAGHAIDLSRRAADSLPDGILAAGGDGTLNQVINGVLQSGKNIPVGVLPLGTGNDFAAHCGIGSVKNIIELLHGEGMPTDVGLLRGFSSTGEPILRYFINIASIGLGPDVVHRLENSSRRFGPDLTYVLETVQAFFKQKPAELNIETPEWRWSGKVRAFAIANGSRFGSGLYVAPEARPDDGIFSTFLAGDVPLLSFLYFLLKIRSKQKITHTKARYDVCNSIHLTAAVPTFIETDGELACLLPASIEVLPQAIKIFR
jgi:diacylglycerol kinase (ATP)